MPASTLNDTILRQRELLTALLGKPMRRLAQDCIPAIHNRSAIEALLRQALSTIDTCKHLYVLDANGHQITDNITREGPDSSYLGRNRSDRPYMAGIVGTTDFKLSESYISRNKKRPMLTAIQVIRDQKGDLVGFLGADYDLRELPGTDGIYNEPQAWRQLKGDPAIRGGLFMQERSESLIDGQLADVLSLMAELMTEHGVFHGKLHFSSSRATIWLTDNPYVYRILSVEELIDPGTCLAYPRRPYTDRATMPADQITEVFNLFYKLRFADETIYLRSGSLNICNSMVGLNFSCDGSHYLHYEEFLRRGLEFWIGAAGM